MARVLNRGVRLHRLKLLGHVISVCKEVVLMVRSHRLDAGRRKAYRKLALQHHPDKCLDLGDWLERKPIWRWT